MSAVAVVLEPHRAEEAGTRRIPREPFGLEFTEEPREVPEILMATTSQWISNPNTKDWDFDED